MFPSRPFSPVRPGGHPALPPGISGTGGTAATPSGAVRTDRDSVPVYRLDAGEAAVGFFWRAAHSSGKWRMFIRLRPMAGGGPGWENAEGHGKGGTAMKTVASGVLWLLLFALLGCAEQQGTPRIEEKKAKMINIRIGPSRAELKNSS